MNVLLINSEASQLLCQSVSFLLLKNRAPLEGYIGLHLTRECKSAFKWRVRITNVRMPMSVTFLDTQVIDSTVTYKYKNTKKVISTNVNQK